MMWTPAKLPPHPSTVPTLSPFAQMVLDGLRMEMSKESQLAGTELQSCRTTSVTNPSRSHEYNEFLAEENYEFSSIREDVNFHRNLRGFGDADKNFLFCPKNANLHNDTVDESLFSNAVPQNLYRINNFRTQENNNCLLSNNVGCSPYFHNDIPTPTFMTQYPGVAGVPPDFEHNPTLDIFEQLSPSMEFEDMEVYSFPQGGIIINPNNDPENLIARKIPPSTFHPPQKYNGNLIHSNTQARVSQNSETCFQNIKQRPNLFCINNMQPSDQKFVLSDKRRSPKLKNKFGVFNTKNTKSGTIQSCYNKPIAPKSNITYSYDYNLGNGTVMNMSQNEHKVGSKDFVEVNQETQSCYRRDKHEDNKEGQCSYEISDLSFENSMKKYYNEETSQLISQDSTIVKSTESYGTEYLENENRKFVEMNITSHSQPELSENCESLFIKTQDFGNSNENCLEENGDGRLNISPNKLKKSSQEMVCSRSFHDFDIDDLFSTNDGILSKNVENYKSNAFKSTNINDKQVIVQDKHIDSDILRQESDTFGRIYQTVNSKMMGLNFDKNPSFQNEFTRNSQLKKDKDNYEDNITTEYKFNKEKTKPNNFKISHEDLTQQYQESKFDFEIEELFTPRTEQQKKTLRKLNLNIHSNRSNNQKQNTLSEHKLSTLYSNTNCCNEGETKSSASELTIQSDSPGKESIPTSIPFKSTKTEVEDDRYLEMCLSKPMAQNTFVIVEENKVQNGEKTTSENIKSHTLLEPQGANIYYDKPNDGNNDKDFFTFHKMYDTDKIIITAEKQKETRSVYFPDSKIQSNKVTADINEHPKNGSTCGLYKGTVHENNTANNSHPNLVNRNTKMKQATIFDCKKFFLSDSRERITTKTDSSIHSLESNNNTSQFDNFKKPQPLYNKSNISTKSNKQCNIKTGQNKDKANTLCKQKTDIPSINGQNAVFQNNYNGTISDKRSTLTKKIQTNIGKTQSNKRSWSSDAPKQKKKPRFTAPVMASHSTSKNTALKNHTITALDDVSADEILQRLSSGALNKLVVTVTFKEGYTLLNKPEVSMKNSRCSPHGIMFMATWDSNKTDFYWLQLHHVDISQSIQVLIKQLFRAASRVVCFEAQAVFMLLLDVFHSTTISDWYAYDPLIACWLLDPDNPPKDFLEVVSKLEVDRSLLVVNPKADTKTQACDLLPVLDIVMVVLEKRLANASLLTLFSDLEMKLTPLLAVMELSSISVDVRKLHEIAGVLDKRLKQLQKEAHSLAGRSFQLNSHQQLRQVLYEDLKLDVKFNVAVKLTEQGSKSTSEAVLLQFQSFHPLPKVVLEFRHLQKVKSTYVDGLIQFVKHDGTIGTVWEQVGAATGRITSKNPNLQAIPKVTVQLPDGENILLRAVFKAREGYTFLAADFQQIEFRVFAHFTEDNTLLQAFHKRNDIFQELAACWLGGAGPVEREKTKRIVYSVMYGAGALKLAEYLQVNFSEASSIIASFVDKFPSLRSLPQTVVAQCRAQGYVVTLSGRRRLFPNIRSTNYKLRAYSERQAINFLIQGSAADICKAAMLDCDRELKAGGLDAKLLLQIHDELVWEVADNDLQQTAQTVRRAMERQWGERLALKVPVPVCVTSGKTLADMQPLPLL